MLRRFFRTPKGLLTIALALLTGVAAPGQGLELVSVVLAAGIIPAAMLDLFLIRWRRHRWEFPDGALLTGWLVAMVLSAHEQWWVVAITAALAVVSKHVFKTRSANVFNPAALAIVITFHLFGTGQSWWGALPDAPVWSWALLFATGVFITDRVNKFPLVLAFIGAFYTLFTVTAFVGDPTKVAEVFRTPDVQAVMFFAFFMLTDPPTSPVRYRGQVICGVLVALVSYGIYELVGAVYYLLAGVLAGNIWEAWSRTRPGSAVRG